MAHLKCFSCIEIFVANGKKKEEWGKVRNSATLVPTWQQKVVGGNLMMACVTLPTCIEHIISKPETPEEIAARTGLAIPGAG